MIVLLRACNMAAPPSLNLLVVSMDQFIMVFILSLSNMFMSSCCYSCIGFHLI